MTTRKQTAYRRWLQERADQRVRDLFAQVDTARPAAEVRERLYELGVTSPHVARRLTQRAIALGAAPASIRRRPGDNARADKERFNEYVREFFKDPRTRLDRPLAPQVRERGGNPKSAQNMSVRARELGVIPPDFHFPHQEPPDLRKPRTPERERVRPPRVRPTRADKPRATKAPSNARERPVPSGFTNGPQAKPAKYEVTRSALDGDGVKSRCPHGCGESFNAFRMRRHVDECPMREEDED